MSDAISTPQEMPARLSSATASSRALGWGVCGSVARQAYIRTMPISSLDAQARIVSICSQASAVTRAAAAAIDRQITLLRERRQALITAAVSGHVDVGG